MDQQHVLLHHKLHRLQNRYWQQAEYGFNAMPAKGGADIPDEEVQNAVDYMVAEAS